MPKTNKNELQVKYRPLKSLEPNPRNARLHSPEQISQIAASIQEFGFTNPILLKDGGKTIGAGHGRYEAALKLGLASVPTITLQGLTETQWRAYVIADNAIALNSSWDMNILSAEVAALKIEMPDLSVLGFDIDEVKEIIAHNSFVESEKDPDAEQPVFDVAVSRLGDRWLLGAHAITCGDSTSAADVALALGGKRPHLMVTDPPYGVNYDANWRNEPEKLNLKSTSAMKSKTAAIGKVLNDDRSDWTEAWALFSGDVAYVWHGERQSPDLVQHLRGCGFEPRNLIVWVKSSLVISRGHYHAQHETCWYAVRKGKAGHWSGDRKQTTVWAIGKPHKSETGHSTQKPVECMKRPIENNSRPGDCVYEPFSGSGTTIIAGEMTKRSVLAIELNPAYVDVAIRRWQEFSGQTAFLEKTGQSFAEVSAERAGASS